MEGRSLNLWHALRRECSGAWRSVRYDLATNKAAKLAGAFTEEFQPSRPPAPARSRLVPLTGVTLLLAGGAAGAFLAISGGLAAVGAPDRSPLARDQVATATTGATTTAAAGGSGGGASPAATRHAAAAPRTSPTPGPQIAGDPEIPAPVPPAPIVEASSLPPSSAPASAGPSSPAPSTSESSQGNTEGPRSRGRRGRR
jgi:hypothetical protein